MHWIAIHFAFNNCFISIGALVVYVLVPCDVVDSLASCCRQLVSTSVAAAKSALIFYPIFSPLLSFIVFVPASKLVLMNVIV